MFLVFQIMLNLHLLLDRRQRGPIRYKIVVVGNWLVGNAVFSETALRMFLIFCMKLGYYKGRKVTEPNFWKKLLIWRYSWKGLQISPKSDTLIFFSKTALAIFLVFGLNLVLNMTFNLNETYFSEKFSIWRYFNPKSSNNYPAGTATLWQYCHNVVIDVVTTLWHDRKWELCRRRFRTLWQRDSPTLSRRCRNVAATSLEHWALDF